MDHELSVSPEQKGDILIFRISGKLDFISTQVFETTLQQTIKQNGKKVVLDFSNLSYISSSGIKLLLEVSKMLKNLSGKLVIFGLQPFPLEIIKDANFDFILEITETEEEALDRFKHENST